MGLRHRYGPGARSLALASLLASAGCLEFSPHQLPSGSDRDLTRVAVERLVSQPPGSPLRFAVLGDTHVDVVETEEVVELLNRRADLSFVVQVGDLTNLGVTGEYRLMNDALRRLHVPYFVIIGNHDMLGNGRDVYQRMFGPLDVAFTVSRTRFVLLDTNSREYGFDGSVPRLGWLREQLAPDPSFDRAIVLSHVDARSPDFEPALVEPFFAALRDLGVAAAFHGHAHAYSEYERDGVRYFIADALDQRWYLLASVEPGGTVTVERVPF